MTAYDERQIIVMREGSEADANLAAKQVDTVGGEQTFSVPLREAGDPTNTVVARWCNWAMRPSEVASLHGQLDNQGLMEDEVLLKPEGANFVPQVRADTLIFDADEWTPEQVLSTLGLDTLAET